MEIHEKVSELRISKGVSQTFIASKLDITVSGYNMKEHGKRPISIKELELIAKIFNVETSSFFDNIIHVKCN
ncbi:helix-turn-helix transcriptional regulator [Sporosarcina sp. ANT_H38]|uniref:helix-turn-helix domain-containing protein n=1 Tax=Sporosarcina sp. ANT_H38 TaxID=2597358 RepID=UPI0011F27F0E|nr:helix-turn-helix transcriptional regulator [Sporosarcina sp. ANT_H38]KAA0941582.1 helix-turn-helix transcriptional regulator [Sporosarcina sp. ANT_H38]